MIWEEVVDDSIVSVTIPVEVNSFPVPSWVTCKTSQPNVHSSYRLEDLTPGALALLCDQFRAAVFAKSGFKDPRLV